MSVFPVPSRLPGTEQAPRKYLMALKELPLKLETLILGLLLISWLEPPFFPLLNGDRNTDFAELLSISQERICAKCLEHRRWSLN